MGRPLSVVALLSLLGLAPPALAQSNPVTPQPSAPGPNADTASPPPSAPPDPSNASQSAPAEPTPAAPVEEPAEPPAAAPAPSAPPPTNVEAPDATAEHATPAPMLSVNKPSVASNVDAPKAAAPFEDWWQQGHGLGVEALARVGTRFGSANELADTESRAGLGFDLGLWLRLAAEYSFGFTLKRQDLGSIDLTQGQSTLDAGYATTMLELGGRAYPLRGKNAELFVGLRVGLAWQDVDAKGLRPSINLQPAQNFECSDVAGPGFALGADVGGALRLARALWLTGAVQFDGLHLTSDQVGNCVAGIGSITALSFGAGLLYTFDIGGDAKVARLPTPARF